MTAVAVGSGDHAAVGAAVGVSVSVDDSAAAAVGVEVGAGLGAAVGASVSVDDSAAAAIGAAVGAGLGAAIGRHGARARGHTKVLSRCTHEPVYVIMTEACGSHPHHVRYL